MKRGRYVTPRISKLLAIPAGRAGRWCAGILLLLGASVVAPASSAAAQEPSVTAREKALKEFSARVEDYVALKHSLERGVPDLKPGDRTTGAVEKVEQTMAMRIQVARKDAKPGDIFGSAAPLIKRSIEKDTQARGVRDAFNAMQEVPAKSPPAVNAVYPETAALATVPPLILVNLPRLPNGLEYRFMGRDLILRDREANVIVDFVPGAVPVLKP